MIIFKFLDAKEAFNETYSRLLAKRLLDVVPVNMENESLLLGQLRATCGHDYTSKMFKMLSDVKKGPHMTENFLGNLSNTISKPTFEFSVKILNARSWHFPHISSNFRSHESDTHLLPLSLHRVVASFETYFTDKNPKKRLTWDHSLSVGEIEGIFYVKNISRTYSFVMSGMQMAIFLEIQHLREKFATTDDLLARLKMDPHKFTASLHPLLSCSLLLQNENTGYLFINTQFYKYALDNLTIVNLKE